MIQELPWRQHPSASPTPFRKVIQVPGDKALGPGRQRDLEKWTVILVRQVLIEGYCCMDFRRMLNVVHYDSHLCSVDIELGAVQNILVLKQNAAVYAWKDLRGC